LNFPETAPRKAAQQHSNTATPQHGNTAAPQHRNTSTHPEFSNYTLLISKISYKFVKSFTYT